jgi:hypothetical protein
LLQDSYIDKLMEKFNLTPSKYPPKTPLPSEELIPYNGEATPEQIHGYQQRVGSANFPSTISRPDVAKATSKLSEFLRNPSPKHIAAADRLLQYLVDTKYFAIEFDGNTVAQQIFVTMGDSAFADDKTTCTSSHGLSVSLYGGIIDFKAIKGRTVTTSSTEAELLAICYVVKVFLRWLRIFQNLGFYLDFTPTIYCDNQQTIRLLTKEAPKLQTALRHVDIHQCWLRQEVQAGHIKVEWISTNQMVADGFTKLLPAQKHHEFVRMLNLVDLKAKLYVEKKLPNA